MVLKNEENLENPLISIALCTYNGERFLAGQLDSLLAQTYRNIEIVAIDDSSTDSTYSILQEYSKNNPVIRLYRNEKNIGFKANFEKVLFLTHGDFIAFADQDDIWLEEKIKILLDNIGNNELIYHDSAFINDKGDLTGKKLSSHHRFVSGFCSKNLLYDNCVSGHATMIRSHVIDRITPFPEYIYYDWWIAYVLSCTGLVTYTNAVLVHYRIHSSSITQKDLPQKRNRVSILNRFLKYNYTPVVVKDLLIALIEGYRKKNGFSFILFFLLFKNYKDLFHVRKRSLSSVLKFIVNECK